jgi:endoglycosylceramidase
MSFDATTGAFSYRYRASGIAAPTEIFVSPLHYADGYRVEITNGTWEAGEGGRVLVHPVVAGSDVVVQITAR